MRDIEQLAVAEVLTCSVMNTCLSIAHDFIENGNRQRDGAWH